MLLFNCVCVHSSSSSSSVSSSKFQSLFDLEPFFLLVSTFPTTSFLTVRTCQQSIMPDLHLGIRNTRQSMDKLGIVLHDTGYIHLPGADESYFWMLHLRSHLWKDEYPIHTWRHPGPDSQPSLVASLLKGLLGFCASRPSRQIYHFMKLGVWPKSLKIQHATFDVQNQIPVDTVGSLSHNSQCFNLFSGCRILSIQRITE